MHTPKLQVKRKLTLHTGKEIYTSHCETIPSHINKKTEEWGLVLPLNFSDKLGIILHGQICSDMDHEMINNNQNT